MHEQCVPGSLSSSPARAWEGGYGNSSRIAATNIHLSTYPSFHLCREPVWDVQLSLPLARFFFQVCFTKVFFFTGLGGRKKKEGREEGGKEKEGREEGGKEKEGKEWGGGERQKSKKE